MQNRTPFFVPVFLVFLLGWAAGCTAEDPAAAVDSAEPFQELPEAHREMVSVPGGSFIQSTPDGESFEHYIDPFSLSARLVTYELWTAVRNWAVEEGAYRFIEPGRRAEPDAAEPDAAHTDAAHTDAEGAEIDLPVTRITWFDAVVWLNAYSELAGLEPVYRGADGRSIVRDATAMEHRPPAITAAANANGYRLPTEGEWQFAAAWRGSSTGGSGGRNDDASGRAQRHDGSYWTPPDWASGAAGPTEEDARAVAWFHGVRDAEAHPVALLQPNALGIYDMNGNLWEWVWDYFAPYPEQAQRNYQGPQQPSAGGSGVYRVIRGGSVTATHALMRIGLRAGFRPEYPEFNNGLRPAR